MRKRGWEKDYYTSCLPWTQRGAEVETPISFTWNDSDDVHDSSGKLSTAGDIDHNASGDLQVNVGGTGGSRVGSIDNSDNLGITINELRTSSALQRWLEKQARGGHRYIETILSHFGVRSSDARLQRAEYIGGQRNPVVISEVLNTSATATEAQGTMAGHGVAVGSGS